MTKSSFKLGLKKYKDSVDFRKGTKTRHDIEKIIKNADDVLPGRRKLV